MSSRLITDESNHNVDDLKWQAAKCLNKFRDYYYHPDVVYCNATFDSYLCWPPTPVGRNVTQNCPPMKFSDNSRLAVRHCGPAGLWMGRRVNEYSTQGWTNYMPCFPPQVQRLLLKVYEDVENAQIKFEIAQRTRYLEIFGFSLSLVALALSLIIFWYYRRLRNNRTRIHKNLFSAMLVQVIIRLTVYFDQALIRNKPDDQSVNYYNETVRGIDNMPYVCESTYVLLEYAISVMFMWIFVEGLYLHNVVTANVLREKISFRWYYFMGWGCPVIITTVWAVVTAIYYEQSENMKTCWYGYNFTPIYWILQAPRLAVVLINLLFLLNIMRVLIIKLKHSQSTETEKIRKAVRAALVLLPLLGITNALNMIEIPLDGGVVAFAVWSYSTHFCRSFQGFFIAFIYCFLNGEVRIVLKKHYNTHMIMRQRTRTQRDNFLQIMASDDLNRPPNNAAETHEMQVINWVPLRLKYEQRQINVNVGEERPRFEPTIENVELNLHEIIRQKNEDDNKATSKMDKKWKRNVDEQKHTVQINAPERTPLRELHKRLKFTFIDESENSDM